MSKSRSRFYRHVSRLLILACSCFAVFAASDAVGQFEPAFWWYHYCDLSHGQVNGEGSTIPDDLTEELCDHSIANGEQDGSCMSVTSRSTPTSGYETVLSLRVADLGNGLYEASVLCVNKNSVSCKGKTAAASSIGVLCGNEDPPPPGLEPGMTRIDC